MKHILLPTDFSKNSINAINYAMELFKDVSCTFYILNVQKASSFISDDMMLVSTSASIYSTIIEASKKSIANIISGVKEKYNNSKHTFEPLVDYDNFIDSINQISKQHDISLIIMGTKGASGLGKMLFGSNTVRVMQRCYVPVLAIPNHCKFNGVNHLAFITNHQTVFNDEQLEWLKTMRTMNNSSQFSVIHVEDEHHIAHTQDQNTDFFNTHFPNATHEYIDTNSKDMFTLVNQYINFNNVDMLAMIQEKHSFLERLFTKHPVETFAFSIQIPFLVM